MRGLTPGERAQIHPGLTEALETAGAEPRLIDAAHPAARLAALWRGEVPILARGARIYWPGAPEDVSAAGEGAAATLQHELQHVLDYAAGELSAVRYLLNPRHWRYGYRLTPASRWSDFGAEQRASIAEHLWLLERGRVGMVERALGAPPAPIGVYRRLIPWAG